MNLRVIWKCINRLEILDFGIISNKHTYSRNCCQAHLFVLQLLMASSKYRQAFESCLWIQEHSTSKLQLFFIRLNLKCQMKHLRKTMHLSLLLCKTIVILQTSGGYCTYSFDLRCFSALVISDSNHKSRYIWCNLTLRFCASTHRLVVFSA